MRKLLLIFSISILIYSCGSEAKLFKVDQTKIGVNYKNTRGTIFKSNYSDQNLYLMNTDSIKNTWTPNKEEIELAEKILKNQIKKINSKRINQLDNCPIIDKNMNSYFRQYVGYTNTKGERIIHINFYWDKYSVWDKIRGFTDTRLEYDSDYALVLDGCSRYWQIDVNLTNQKLNHLQINGVA